MSKAQEQLGSMAVTIFALNSQFHKLAEQLATPAGLTVTSWKVLGAVLKESHTQAEIARKMGITRQSVRRTSIQLVKDGMAQWLPNPSHRKANLLQPTEKGYAAVRKIAPQHAVFAKKLEDELGPEWMTLLSETLTELHDVLDTLIPSEEE